VTGIDIDKAAIALANNWYGATPRLDFRVEDANAMTSRGEFGLVFCMDSLHHFPSLRRILRACYDALVSGGLLYIIDLYREATPSDAFAMSILDLRRRISEKEFVRRTLDNKVLQDGDFITNLRKLQTANSKLAAYSLKEIRHALRNAGFTDTNSGVSPASVEAPEKVIFAALKP
jgi:2-polyprenyl-3-methyl-5-hydroxy-6-metoxy-1,4-benzoquinol methylase